MSMKSLILDSVKLLSFSEDVFMVKYMVYEGGSTNDKDSITT